MFDCILLIYFSFVICSVIYSVISNAFIVHNIPANVKQDKDKIDVITVFCYHKNIWLLKARALTFRL